MQHQHTYIGLKEDLRDINSSLSSPLGETDMEISKFPITIVYTIRFMGGCWIVGWVYNEIVSPSNIPTEKYLL